MPRLIPLFMASVMLAAAGMAQAATDRSPAEQLDRVTVGRVAGKPVDCLNLQDIRSSRIIDNTAIIYETNGGTVYVNKPTSGASSLRSDLVLVTDTHSPQLCSVDIVRLYDSGIRMQSGTIGLGQFIPYSRPARGSGN
jgi:hypothetical protein